MLRYDLLAVRLENPTKNISWIFRFSMLQLVCMFYTTNIFCNLKHYSDTLHQGVTEQNLFPIDFTPMSVGGLSSNFSCLFSS